MHLVDIHMQAREHGSACGYSSSKLNWQLPRNVAYVGVAQLLPFFMNIGRIA
jgi:hypothetical protein